MMAIDIRSDSVICYWYVVSRKLHEADFLVFTARRTIGQSAVLRLHVVHLSVCLSVRLHVGRSGPHMLEILETNCADN